MNMSTIFAQTKQLPHIPKVVQEIMDSFRDENVDTYEISKKVAMDQALTAKVLRLANSAHYGMPRTVGNPHDAVMLLGFSTLRTMVLASGVTGAFKLDGFDQKVFWKDAFAVASLSKWLAQYVPGCDKETAFTCGMVHSVGELLIRMVMPEEAARIDDTLKSSMAERHMIERTQLGFDSADVGAELAKRWKFPDLIQEAIKQQNAPGTDEDYSRKAGLIYISKYLKKAHDDNLSDEEIVASFPMGVAKKIGMDVKQAEQDLKEIDDLSSGLDGLLE